MKKRIWLSPPHMSENEALYIKEAFDTNWIAPIGPNINRFEQQLSEYFSGHHVLALNSGTAALHLALVLLGVTHGDEVICQSFTFSASVNPVLYQGAKPVFVDSESETWNMDPDLLEQAIIDRLALGKEIKAIVVINLYGMPAKLKTISTIALRYAIPLVEDSAEALGSSIDNLPCGTFGSMGVVSFNGNKIITTSSGGVLITASSDLIANAKHLASQAKDDAHYYQHSKIGYNYRMSNVLAGIGLGQLVVLNERIQSRRNNYQRYVDYFSLQNKNGFEILFQIEPAGYFSNRWLTCILVDPAQNKGLSVEIIRLALEKNNIEARLLWKPMHQQPIFNMYPFYDNGTSNRLFDIGLCLPSGSSLTDNDFVTIFECFDHLFQNYS